MDAGADADVEMETDEALWHGPVGGGAARRVCSDS